ncbi:hypothetical protein [Nonlabens antarcticus]|uniref:hypothetical protein n=1 Tax=Nonlabens antarcticus TaxID=392714 RepID=UPI001891C560|nr:hypothetical protein [Nonlabens antarcticus]
MNFIRIVGVLLLITAIVLQVTLEHDAVDFVSGILVGSGLIFAITGRFRSRKKQVI